MTICIGIAPSRTFPGTWTEIIDFSLQNSFRAVELKYELPFIVPDRFPRKRLGELAAVVDAETIFLSIHGPYTNIGSLPNTRWNAAIDEHLEAIEVAQCLGARTYTIHGGWVESKYATADLIAQCRNRITRGLRRVVAAAGDLPVCLENQNAAEAGKVKCTLAAADLRGFAEAVGERLRFTFDIGHANVAQSDPSTFMIDLGPKRIGVAHIHDNDGSQDTHEAVGSGTIDWSRFVEAYLQHQCTFPLMLELGSPDEMLSSRKALEALLAAGVRQ